MGYLYLLGSSILLLIVAEGNGTPLQYSCLENPMDSSPWGRYELDTTERLHFSLSYIGEGNGNPLQCSCLENPRDGGGWWAAVYGVPQSRTLLKWRSSSSSSILLSMVVQQLVEILVPNTYGCAAFQANIFIEKAALKTLELWKFRSSTRKSCNSCFEIHCFLLRLK